MGNIQLFTSSQFGEVRVVGDQQNPEFCLTDVCRVLGLTPSKVVQRLSKDVLSKYPLQTNGGEQLTNFVNEDGLYDVILDSRKPEARAFRKWVTSDVLPSIRKTGGYIPGDTDEEIMAKALQIAERTIREKSVRIQVLEGKNALLSQENKELAPKAQYTDQVLQSPSTYTHTQMAKELDMRSVNVFLARCQRDAILYKQSGVWMPYAKFAGKGYMKMRTTPYTRSDGTVGTSTISVWTEEGRRFLHDHFNVALKPVDITMFEFPDNEI